LGTTARDGSLTRAFGNFTERGTALAILDLPTASHLIRSHVRRRTARAIRKNQQHRVFAFVEADRIAAAPTSTRVLEGGAEKNGGLSALSKKH
jgi:hypothetical protein